jgi:hypothetical protein
MMIQYRVRMGWGKLLSLTVKGPGMFPADDDIVTAPPAVVVVFATIPCAIAND